MALGNLSQNLSEVPTAEAGPAPHPISEEDPSCQFVMP